MTIPFASQHTGGRGEEGEERRQGESTVVKLAMSPPRQGEEGDMHGRRRRPEPGMGSDQDERATNKKGKSDANN